MRLDSFHIQGFRSLADVSDIPLRRPTILTGHNDGGKSATLTALAFLLGKYEPALEDHTFQCEESSTAQDDSHQDTSLMEAQEPGEFSRRAPEIIATGKFTLSTAEQEEVGLPPTIQLRRRASGSDAPVYELLQAVPADPELRGIADMKLLELKQLAIGRGIEPEGPANRLESWRKPLTDLASSGDHVDDWTRASRSVIQRLPVYLAFSSTDEPDPEAQVRKVLQASYERMLADPDLIGPVHDLEQKVSDRLQAEAQQLCRHIQERVPELTSVSAVPSLAFRHGLSNVQLRAFKGNEDVGLRHAGAGRQRRISLAVWEWTSQIITAPPEEDDDDASVVIAYDEPDTHLDYAKQRDLVDLIHTQCENPQARMIVATHSLNLIDRVDIADVVQLHLDDSGRTVAERLTDETHEGVDRYLASISAALGLRTSVLLHERCFLAVEGPTEQQTFPILFRLAMNRPLQSAGIALIACNGNEGALKVTRFLIEHNRKVVFILDKDSETNPATRKLFKRDKLRSYLITDEHVHYIGDSNELEELFTDDQWTETANELWPRYDGRLWTSRDFSELRGSGKFSDALKDLIRKSSEAAPSSKQEMNLGLALRLRSADEVPGELRKIFEQISEISRGG